MQLLLKQDDRYIFGVLVDEYTEYVFGVQKWRQSKGEGVTKMAELGRQWGVSFKKNWKIGIMSFMDDPIKYYYVPECKFGMS